MRKWQVPTWSGSRYLWYQGKHKISSALSFPCVVDHTKDTQVWWDLNKRTILCLVNFAHEHPILEIKQYSGLQSQVQHKSYHLAHKTWEQHKNYSKKKSFIRTSWRCSLCRLETILEWQTCNLAKKHKWIKLSYVLSHPNMTFWNNLYRPINGSEKRYQENKRPGDASPIKGRSSSWGCIGITELHQSLETQDIIQKIPSRSKPKKNGKADPTRNGLEIWPPTYTKESYLVASRGLDAVLEQRHRIE